MIIRKDSLDPIEFDGLTIVDYTAGRELRSSMAVIDVPAGAAHAEAWSKRSDKYYLVIDGAIDFSLQGERHSLEAGDFVFVEQGQRFSYANNATAVARLVLVHTPNFDLDSEVIVAMTN